MKTLIQCKAIPALHNYRSEVCVVSIKVTRASELLNAGNDNDKIECKEEPLLLTLQINRPELNRGLGSGDFGPGILTK